jgi:hypothetical protein
MLPVLKKLGVDPLTVSSAQSCLNMKSKDIESSLNSEITNLKRSEVFEDPIEDNQVDP